MRRILRRLTPRLTRRAWIALTGQWFAILVALWFVIPIQPTLTIQSPFTVVPFAFTDDEQFVMTLDWDVDKEQSRWAEYLRGPIRRWDIRPGRLAETLPLDLDLNYRVVLSPDGATLALFPRARPGNGDAPKDNDDEVAVGEAEREKEPQLVLYGLAERRELTRLPFHGVPGAENFSPKGTWFFVQSGISDSTLVAYNTKTGQTWRHHRPGRDGLVDVAFAWAPNVETLAICLFTDWDHYLIEHWNLDTGQLLWSTTTAFPPAAFSPDGELLALGRQDGGVQLVDAASGRRMHEFALPEDLWSKINSERFNGEAAVLRRVRFNSSGTRLTFVQFGEPLSTMTQFERLVTWEVATGRPTAQLLETKRYERSKYYFYAPPHVTLDAGFVFCHDLTLGCDVLYRLEDATPVAFALENATISSLSPDGRFLMEYHESKPYPPWLKKLSSRARIALHAEDKVTVRDLKGRGRTVTLPSGPLTMVFSRDGARLATQSSDAKTLHVWDLPARPTAGQLLAWSAGPCVLAFVLTWGWCAWRRRRTVA